MLSQAIDRRPRRWVPRTRGGQDAASQAAALASALRLPLPLGQLLVARGHASDATARTFLRPRLDQLHDPHALAGLDDAVTRIRAAIRAGETILVHGDYDVDGVCTAALYTRVLRSLGARVEPFVPHRVRDGYDFGAAGVRRAAEVGARLVLTGDCGIGAAHAVAAARAAGIDVVVTDHHRPGATLPPAVAVVDPGRPDCTYPHKGLCGAGVAFKLCQALVQAEDGDEEDLLYHLDLVALATVADLVPLRGENRVFVRYGLRVLPRSRKAGVRALLREAGLADGPLSAGHLSHGLGPRINAAGRVGEAEWALRLFLTDDEAEAATLARELEASNRRRREVDRETLGEAMALLEADYDPARDFGLVLAREGWHPGVIGIVASRVVEEVHRPTALVALAGGRGRGSARSVRGFDLFAAIRDCGDHLERFGGHRQAAGFDVSEDRLAAFRAAFNARAAAELADRDLSGEVEYDLELPLADANGELLRLLAHLGPFGVGNPTPVFVARAARLAAAPKRVGENHLRLDLRQGDARVAGIAFGLADRIDPRIRGGETIDVAFHLQEDRWNGRTRIQARVLDLRPPAGSSPAA